MCHKTVDVCLEYRGRNIGFDDPSVDDIFKCLANILLFVFTPPWVNGV